MAEKILQYAEEYKYAVADSMEMGVKMMSPFERVRMVEWIRKLNTLKDDVLEEVRMKNEYAQYLRVCLKSEIKILPKPFSSQPPKTVLVPLAEFLGNVVAEMCQNVPRTGRLQPMICHKSDDDRSFLTVKRTPEGGIFCYMAVAPDALALRPNEKI